MKYLTMILTVVVFTPAVSKADYMEGNGSAIVCKAFGTGFFNVKGACARHKARKAAASKAETNLNQKCNKENGFIWGDAITKTKCSVLREVESVNKLEVCVTCQARTLALCG